MRKAYILIIPILFFSVSCGGGGQKRNGSLNEIAAHMPERTAAAVELIGNVSPGPRNDFRQGDDVRISYAVVSDTLTPDSVILYMNGVRKGPMGREYLYLTNAEHPVGRIPYRIIAYKDRDSTVRVGEFVIKPVNKPVRYGYRIVNTFPHDRTAYTQGLYWHQGYLYEGTGQEGQSSLRRVDLATGKVQKIKNLDRQYFGEGIALLGGKIYQLTWTTNRGFIYDAESFQQIGEFGYSGEGWGLTTDGTRLYMSDGSERIHVIDPEGFKKIRSIDVYTDEGRVTQLNELEWIDGEIWANVYMSESIVRIDPATGIVTGIIDMRGLLKSSDKDIHTDVLNGIAYDPAGKRIFVTGKNWSKLFQIELVRR